jgi:isopentenyl diphosphate isomerase/L-lactate dehydrogenase-like FMN-dependent dehydrogenase
MMPPRNTIQRNSRSGITSFAAINIEELRSKARRRLPRVVFDYIDGGAEDEITLRANRDAFNQLAFRPHQAVRHSAYSTKTSILGVNLSLPILLAPVGYSRLFHPDGEIGAAAAASRMGTIYILSSISGHSLEEVKAASPFGAWFQLYLLAGREAGEATLDRARRAGFSALVVTVDTAVAGMRERDLRNGMKQLMQNRLLAKLPFIPQLLSSPQWLTRFLLDGGVPRLPNVIVPGQGPMPMTDVAAALEHASVTWEDLPWIRQVWGGTLVIKGISTAEDARRCVDYGASAVIVSNHGGRQLDGVSASLCALPEVTRAVAGEADVLMDGGIRRGSDVVKAICCGAKAVLIGRAYAYGLAAAGMHGVERALEILRCDIERTLKLLGCESVRRLENSWIEPQALVR